MMHLTPPKSMRENLARARSYLRRNDMVRSLDAMCKAMREVVTARLFGQARYEVEVLIFEYVSELNKHPEIASFFQKRKIHAAPFVRYARGEEEELLERFESIYTGMRQEHEDHTQKRVERKLSKKSDLLERGKALMAQKDYPRGKGVLRRVVEGWGHEEGLTTDIALLFLEHQLYMEAVALFEQVIVQFPGDSRAYGGAVRCYKELHEFEKCEAVYLKALKQFGSHPRTLLNMAELYKRWRKLDKAYDYARRAVSADCTLKEARAMVEEMESRLF